MNKENLWTKDFIITCSINFMVTLIFFLLMVTMSAFAIENFNASTSEAGLVAGIFIIGALIGRLFAGRFIENIGRKKLLLIGLIYYTITTFFYFWVDSLFLLLVNRLLHGMALGISSTSTGTIIAQIVPAKRKGEGISYFSSSAVLGTAIGPFLGLFLSEYTSYQTIYGLCLFLGFLSLCMLIFLRVPSMEQAAKHETSDNKGIKLSNYIEYRAIPIAIVTLIIGTTYSSVLSFITFYAKEIHLLETSSLFFVFYAIMVIISRPFTGRLLDTKGANIIIYPAILLYAAGMFLLSIVEAGWTFLLAAAIIGLGYGNFTSSAQTVCIKVTPSHRFGLANSTYFIFLDIGLGFGPYFVGLLIPYTGYSGLYMTMSIIIISSIFLYYFIFGKKEKDNQVQRVKLSKMNL